MSGDAICPPLYITPENCQATMGMRWRNVKRAALAHEIPIVYIGRKPAIRCALFIALLERLAQRAAPPAAPEPGARLTERYERLARERALKLQRQAARQRG